MQDSPCKMLERSIETPNPCDVYYIHTPQIGLLCWNSRKQIAVAQMRVDRHCFSE